jgi:hypothetical protein
MYTLNEISAFTSPEPDTYIYNIVPISSGLAAISSDNSLRLLDPLNLNGRPINSVRLINQNVTCLKAFGRSGELEMVCTAGRDGRVVLLDPRTGAKVGEVRSGE